MCIRLIISTFVHRLDTLSEVYERNGPASWKWLGARWDVWRSHYNFCYCRTYYNTRCFHRRWKYFENRRTRWIVPERVTLTSSPYLDDDFPTWWWLLLPLSFHEGTKMALPVVIYNDVITVLRRRGAARALSRGCKDTRKELIDERKKKKHFRERERSLTSYD